MPSITSANAVVMLTLPGVYAAPQQIQQFAADEMFDTETLQQIEVMMGIDGTLSGAYTFKAVPQSFTLQANSPSCQFFDTWRNSENAAEDVFQAAGVITLKSISTKWTLVNGFLTQYKPMPDAGTSLKARKFGVTWQTMTPMPS